MSTSDPISLAHLRRLCAAFYAQYAECPTRLRISYKDYYALVDDSDLARYGCRDLKSGEITIMGMDVEITRDGEVSVL